MIDVSKIKVGDEVTVRMTVAEALCRSSGELGVSCEYWPKHFSTWIYAKSIATHTPKPRKFKPGDRVTWGTLDHTYEFVAKRGGTAFLWSEDAGAAVPFLSDIRHADESE